MAASALPWRGAGGASSPAPQARPGTSAGRRGGFTAHLGGHTSLGGTLALAVAGLAALGLGLGGLASAEAGVDVVVLLDDEPILHELADGLPCDHEEPERQGHQARARRGGGGESRIAFLSEGFQRVQPGRPPQQTARLSSRSVTPSPIYRANTTIRGRNTPGSAPPRPISRYPATRDCAPPPVRGAMGP